MKNKEKEVMNFYDKYNFSSPFGYGLKRYSFFKKIIPKDVKLKALDTGSGSGRTSLLMHKLNPKIDITAIDISRDSLQKLPKFIKVRKADILNLPFKDKSFDIVCSIGVVHHTVNPEKAINECGRVLKNNGQLIIGVINKYSLSIPVYKLTKHTPRFIKNKFKNPLIHDIFFNPLINPRSFKEIKNSFEKNNIELIDYSATYYFPLFFRILGHMIYYYGLKQRNLYSKQHRIRAVLSKKPNVL